MSTLESLVYDRLAASEAVTSLLATVDTDEPAIFVEQAPDSSSKRWSEPTAQTPRIVLTVQRIEDPARGSDATLLVDLYGPSDALPALSAAVQAALSGVYWHPEGEPPLATRVRSATPDPNLAAFASTEDAIALSFDIVALPDSPTFDPDPIAALYGLFENVLTDGDPDDPQPTAQTDPAEWDADEGIPALYLTLRNENLVRRWPTRFQWQAEVRGHVLGPAATARQRVLRQMTQALVLTPDVRLSNGGRLMIDKPIGFDLAADPLRQGQFSAQVQFWTAKPPNTAERIAHVEVRGSDLPLVEVPADV